MFKNDREDIVHDTACYPTSQKCESSVTAHFHKLKTTAYLTLTWDHLATMPHLISGVLRLMVA